MASPQPPPTTPPATAVSLPLGLSVLATGSRDWKRDAGRYLEQLSLACPLLDVAADVTLTHGDCRGADKLCAAAARRRGWEVNPCPADWDGWRARGCVAAAGGARNQEMIDEVEPQYAIALFTPESTGTWDAVKRLQRWARKSERFRLLLVVCEDRAGDIHTYLYNRDEFRRQRLTRAQFHLV